MALRQGKLDLLVTTTILERGVTLPHCQVCILGADDELYTRASLMQMSGRVGRSADQPTGALWWLHQGQSLATATWRAQSDGSGARALAGQLGGGKFEVYHVPRSLPSGAGHLGLPILGSLA